MKLTKGNSFVAGLGMLGGILVVVILATSINLNFGLPGNVNLGWPPGFDYNLSAAFDDANGLARGADVVVGGAAVGQVTSVSASGRQAVATMRIDRQYSPVRQGTIARIRYSTLLAQKYVELAPAATGNPIPSGGRIPSTSTLTPVDFDQFLSTLDPETRQQLQVIVQQLGGGVEGRQQAINYLLDNLGNLSVESQPGLDTFARHTGDVASITANLATVSHRLAQSHDNLGGFVQHTGEVNGTVAAQNQSLAGLIYHLANTMDDFNGTLNGEEGNFHDTVTGFDPFLTDLNGTLGIVDPYLHNNLPALKTGLNTLIPYIGSAINQKDANGNYLRQYLIGDNCYDSVQTDAKSPPAGCSRGTAPAASGNQSTPGSGTAPGGGGGSAPAPAPVPSICPSVPPVLPTPSALPLPTPLPAIKPCPTPLPPCVPLPGRPSPSPIPTPSPGSCIPGPGLINPPGVTVPPVNPAPLPTIITGLLTGGV